MIGNSHQQLDLPETGHLLAVIGRERERVRTAIADERDVSDVGCGADQVPVFGQIDDPIHQRIGVVRDQRQVLAERIISIDVRLLIGLDGCVVEDRPRR